MAVADVYELTFDLQVKGEHCYNVFRMRETGASTDDIPAKTLAEAVHAAWVDDWADLLSEEAIFACLYCRRISPAPGVAYTELLNEPGTIESESIPTTSAVIITEYTALASKRGRGRNYFAGVPESSQAGGKLEGDVLAAWVAFAALLRTAVVAGGGGTGTWELCVWSTASMAAQDVKAATVRTNLGTMRTRRQKPGVS